MSSRLRWVALALLLALAPGCGAAAIAKTNELAKRIDRLEERVEDLEHPQEARRDDR